MRPPSVPTTIPVDRDSDSKQVVIMKSLYNSLIEYRDEQHRILIQLFMCLPSRKDFPEYFDIIAKPIAMNKIRERIERQQYQDEEACLEDFKLMFSNCKFFNEDDSQIYRDAVTLENVLLKKRERLQIEFSRPSRYSKEAAKEALLNNLNTTTIGTTQNSNSTTSSSLNNTSSTSSPAVKSERIHNHHTNSNNNINSNNATNNHTTTTTKASPSNSINPSTNNLDSPHTKDPSSRQQQESNNISTSKNSTNSTTNSASANNNINTSSYHTSTAAYNADPSTPKSSSTNNGINRDAINQQSDSTNQSSTTDQQNGNDDLEVNSIKVNHNHHNETSMDSSSNLSADLLASTPVEKCSLNTRRGRNSDAPKRQLLTGYIIYASEIRKQVIDKNPNQNFGDISRLVGNEWKALPHDIRSKYDQRALIHNKRVRERAQRELTVDGSSRLANGIHTPKMTKRKLAKLAKEQMRQHHLSISGHDESSTQSPRISQEHSSSMVSQTPSSNYKHQHHQHSQPQANPQTTSSKSTTVESSTQTIAIRFVEPPTKKRLVYSDTFRKYIESLQVPNKDLLAEETTPERPAELPTHWLGAGIGRHESPEAALWALRDFMLQDAITMRRSMEPYL